MTNTVTYSIAKRVIERQGYQSKEDFQIKLDVFFMAGRITEPEYLELTKLLESQPDKTPTA